MNFLQDPPPPYEQIDPPQYQPLLPQDQKQQEPVEQKINKAGLRSLDQNCSPFYEPIPRQAENQNNQPVFSLVRPSDLNCMAIPQSENSTATYAWIAVALVVVLLGKSLLS